MPEKKLARPNASISTRKPILFSDRWGVITAENSVGSRVS